MAPTSPGPDRAAQTPGGITSGAFSTSTLRRLDELVERARLTGSRGGIYIVAVPDIEQAPTIWKEIVDRLPDREHVLIDQGSDSDVLARRDVVQASASGEGRIVGIVPRSEPVEWRRALLTALNVRRELVFEHAIVLVLFVDERL